MATTQLQSVDFDKDSECLFFDVEEGENSGLSRDEVGRSLAVFLTGMLKEDYVCGIYTSYYYWRDSVNWSVVKGVEVLPLWIAHYTNAAQPLVPEPWTKWHFWQYSNTGRVEGVGNGKVDVDMNCMAEEY